MKIKNICAIARDIQEDMINSHYIDRFYSILYSFGHTKSRHFDKSEEDLISRIKCERTTGMASSFVNMTEQQVADMLNQMIKDNLFYICTYIADTSDDEPYGFIVPAGRKVGISVRITSNTVICEECSDVMIVVSKRRGFGFEVVCCYPTSDTYDANRGQ